MSGRVRAWQLRRVRLPQSRPLSFETSHPLAVSDFSHSSSSHLLSRCFPFSLFWTVFVVFVIHSFHSPATASARSSTIPRPCYSATNYSCSAIVREHRLSLVRYQTILHRFGYFPILRIYDIVITSPRHVSAITLGLDHSRTGCSTSTIAFLLFFYRAALDSA